MSTIVRNDRLPVRTEHDVVQARRVVRQLTSEMGFGLVDQTKLVTAASELARNTVIHGRGGEMAWEGVHDGGRTGLRLVFTDEGPGIADLGLALTDGWSTGNGLGLGLSGARRLVHEFAVDSGPGRGTTVTVLRWR